MNPAATTEYVWLAAALVTRDGRELASGVMMRVNVAGAGVFPPEKPTPALSQVVADRDINRVHRPAACSTFIPDAPLPDDPQVTKGTRLLVAVAGQRYAVTHWQPCKCDQAHFPRRGHGGGHVHFQCETVGRV